MSWRYHRHSNDVQLSDISDIILGAKDSNPLFHFSLVCNTCRNWPVVRNTCRNWPVIRMLFACCRPPVICELSVLPLNLTQFGPVLAYITLIVLLLDSRTRMQSLSAEERSPSCFPNIWQFPPESDTRESTTMSEVIKLDHWTLYST